MNAHLSDDQVTEWILGNYREDVSRHLEACDACRVEVVELRGTLSHFRDTVRATSRGDDTFWREQLFAVRRRLPSGRWRAPLGWIWATAATAVLVAATLLMRPSKPPQVSSARDADEDLMDAVQIDVGREYPAALAPAVLIAEERNKILDSEEDHKSHPDERQTK